MVSVSSLLTAAAGLVSVVLAQSGTFLNPVLWEDLADLDVFRVNDTYYYSASTMHYSPGAPILRSYDLVNWEYIGHSVPSLSWSSKYDLTNGQRAYIKGIWASTMRYRASTNTWYWIGCIEFGNTYVYTAPAVTGPWTLKSTITTCFYDCGLLIDDDDSMYVAYGSTNTMVAKLSSDGLSITSTKQVYANTASLYIEGNRMYKVSGTYYIFVTHPSSEELVLKSSSPQGTYTIKALVNGATPPYSGQGNPHQGGLVEDQNGKYYYYAFVDNYPGGRSPVVAPLTFGSDGFPVVSLSNNVWPKSQTYYLSNAASKVQSPLGTDYFNGTTLAAWWEFNHNPDTTKYSVNNGLTLSTATVTTDLYQARNTITKRIHGETGTGTVLIDFTNMADGDRAGLVVLRDQSGWLGVQRDGSSYTIALTLGINMNSDWTTQSVGSVSWSTSISQKKVWLRTVADIAPSSDRKATFSYSLDGVTFTSVTGSLTLENNWEFFMGYRYGIFNYATKALGGSILVESFTSATSGQ